MSTPIHMTNCPSEETLAAFIDGRLDPEARQRVMEHVTTCGDCYDIVSAAWDFQAAEPAQPGRGEGGRGEGRVAEGGGRVVRGRFGFRAVWASAAAVAVAAAVSIVILAPFNKYSRRHAENRSIVEATKNLSYRPIEPRLTGAFPYKPARRVFRGAADDVDPQQWPLMRVAAEAATEVEHNATPENLHTLGVSKLLIGRTDEAVQRLEQALLRSTHQADVVKALAEARDASLLTDLSAAYYVRARQPGHDKDLVLAGEAASRAWRLDPTSNSAAWNRALVLEALPVRDAAREAWNDYLKIDSSSQWAIEAREHLRKIDTTPLSQQWDEVRPRLLDAARRNEMALVLQIVGQYPEQCRTLIEEELLGDWAEAQARGDGQAAHAALALSSTVARAISEKLGEKLPLDSTFVVMHATDATVSGLAEGHREYRLGRKLYREARYADAQRHFRVAATALSQGASPLHLRADMFGATTEMYLGQVSDAAGHCRELLVKLQPHCIDYPTVVAQTHWTSGLIAMSKGYLDDALMHHLAAFTAFQQSGETSNLAGLAQVISDDYRGVGDIDNAWAYHMRAFRLADSFATFERQHVVVNGGALSALRDGFPALAADLQRVVVKNARAARNPLFLCDALLRASEIESALGAYFDARSHIAEALTQWGEIPESNSKTRLRADLEMARAALISEQEPNARIAAIDRALEYVRYSPARYSRALLMRARVYIAAGQLESAERDLAAGIAAVETDRSKTESDRTREMFLATTSALYDESVRLSLARGAIEEAFNYAERRRARWLLDRFASETLNLSTAEVLSWARLRHDIPPRTVLVSYFITDSVDAWIATTDDLKRVRIASTSREIVRHVREWQLAITSGDNDELRWHAAVLYGALMRPFERDLVGADQVVVIPDGPLYGLAFSAMFNEQTRRYIVEDFGITIAPSANLYVRSLRRASKLSLLQGGGALVIANPSLPSDETTRAILPNADAEGLRATAGAAAILLRGSEATPSRVIALADRAERIHFAVHGLANVGHPDRSALLLAPEPGGRSRLYARDICLMKLPNTRLVVLAACDSAKPDTTSDAPLTLATSFLATGVPQVVASLWQVDDRASVAIFRDFYEALHRGASVASALRAAQLAAIHDRVNVSIWSTFEVIGS